MSEKLKCSVERKGESVNITYRNTTYYMELPEDTNLAAVQEIFLRAFGEGKSEAAKQIFTELESILKLDITTEEWQKFKKKWGW